MVMAKIDQRTKRALFIFTGSAIFIILTGIVFKARDIYATGPVRLGRYQSPTIKTLDGYQIIWVGIIMLIVVLIILLTILKSKKR